MFKILETKKKIGTFFFFSYLAFQINKSIYHFRELKEGNKKHHPDHWGVHTRQCINQMKEYKTPWTWTAKNHSKFNVQ